jgi:hypothetical protein
MTKTPDNGGSAFPQFDVIAGDRDGHGDAIEAYTTATGGMTLRDYFAGQALAGWMASFGYDNAVKPDGCAQLAYELADAMLAARKGGAA